MLYKFYLNSFVLGLSYSFLTAINTYRRTSQVVQGLRLHAPNVVCWGGCRFNPYLGNSIP